MKLAVVKVIEPSPNVIQPIGAKARFSPSPDA